MALDKKLLEILACPVCKEGVSPTPEEVGLACPKCHRIYPVIDGIPVMMVDRATMPSE